MSNTSLKLTGLDFSSLKNNFKEYLKRSDSSFKDLDFEGSNINQLLDILTYNTYLNSFYLNMVGSEMFLDSATLRDSAVSHAKELNYVPRSYRSAEAKVSFNVTTTGGITTLLIPKGTSFTTKVGSNSYSFSTSDNLVVPANTSSIVKVESLPIYEGWYIVDSFVYTSDNSKQRFILSNPTIDTTSITVLVIENSGANSTTFARATSFLDQTSNSNIYFLQGAENGQYEIVFGDNIIGKKPQNGAVIAVEYRACSGELPNGASTFFLDGPIQGQSNISIISTTQQASGGAVAESIESIKYNAPRSYQNQNRAITTTDYENILKANFSEIQAVSAYGGEDIAPPQYGKVFIAVDVKVGDGASTSDKNRFFNFIKPRSPLGITPVFIDPEFLFVDVGVTVDYNTNITTLSPSDIETLVRNEISSYDTNFLNDFKTTLRTSKLIERINNCHNSILGVELNIYPNRRILPTPNQPYSQVVDYGFKLSNVLNIAVTSENYKKSTVKAVYSSRFLFQGLIATIQDNGDGTLGLYTLDANNNNIFNSNVGSIDYEKGIVYIENLVISDFITSPIHIHVNPAEKDITSSKNTILKISETDTEINVVPQVE